MKRTSYIVNGEEFTREQLENAKDGETMRKINSS